jgi:hypothetical protein
MLELVKKYDPTLPRVTQILKATEDPAATERLRKWKNKMDKLHGVGGAEKVGRDARELGTDFHSYIEQYIESGDEPKVPKAEQSRWEAGRETLQAFRPHIFSTEQPIQSDTMGYRGILDALAFPNCPMVVDWKTSKRVKRESWIADYKLQVTAYGLACRELGIPVEGAQIIIFSPERCQRFIVDIDEYIPVWLERLNAYKALNK